jgi:predicted nucleic acid-binding protein
MALKPLFLADKSAWEQARYDSQASQRISELRDNQQLAVCVISLAEMLYSARNAREIAQARIEMSSLSFLEFTLAAQQQVADTMAALALKGRHRTSIPDLLLAAIAHIHNAVILHYDSDYERIAEVTGQQHEWIIPRGTGHGNNS